jgi:N-acetylglucosaminyl-diphospho-decaprenol L-rhamnosyltransferase
MPDLAVSVVSWNVRDLLAACLRSVEMSAAAAGLDVAVWVLDNASHDGSAEMVAAEFPGAHLLVSSAYLARGDGVLECASARGCSIGGRARWPWGAERR